MRELNITIQDPEEERALLEYLHRLRSVSVRDLTAEQEQREWEAMPAELRARIEHRIAYGGSGISWEEMERRNARFFQRD